MTDRTGGYVIRGLTKEEGEVTLVEHAEMWARSRGESIPPRDSKEWRDLFRRWLNHVSDIGRRYTDEKDNR